MFVTNDIRPDRANPGKGFAANPGGTTLTATQIDTEIEIINDMLGTAAKAAGWEVIQGDDPYLLASRSVVEDLHIVCVRPGEGLPSTRSINDKPADKTNAVAQTMAWLIVPALRDAEYRGSQGEFTHLTGS